MIKYQITENNLEILHHNKMKLYNKLSKICDGSKQHKTHTGVVVVIETGIPNMIKVISLPLAF